VMRTPASGVPAASRTLPSTTAWVASSKGKVETGTRAVASTRLDSPPASTGWDDPGVPGSSAFGQLAWDGSNWIRRSPATSPSPRAGSGLAYDSARGRTVLYGGAGLNAGHGSTWEYGPVDPASYGPFGSGCAGSAGTPALAAAAGQLPWIGEGFTLELTNLPPSTAALVLTGDSRTSWGAIPLPLALGAVGMPGCSLYVSGTLVLPAAAAGGRGVLTLAIPGDQVLVGAPLYNQAFIADPSANPLGVTSSNAGEAKIGSK